MSQDTKLTAKSDAAREWWQSQEDIIESIPDTLAAYAHTEKLAVLVDAEQRCLGIADGRAGSGMAYAAAFACAAAIHQMIADLEAEK